MIDHGLAIRYLNRTGRNLVDGMSKTEDPDVRRYFQEALNNLSFLYDILHLNEVEVIDIKNKTVGQGLEREVKNTVPANAITSTTSEVRNTDRVINTDRSRCFFSTGVSTRRSRWRASASMASGLRKMLKNP